MTVPDPVRLDAWRNVLIAHRRVTQLLADELDDDEWLPLPWYDVLVQLSEAPRHRLRFQELAEAVLLSASGLSRLVDRMEAAGLVNREPVEDDGRGLWAVMSTHGRARLRATAPRHLDGVHRHFTRHLDDAQAVVVRDAMRRVIDELDG